MTQRLNEAWHGDPEGPTAPYSKKEITNEPKKIPAPSPINWVYRPSSTVPDSTGFSDSQERRAEEDSLA